LKLQNLEGSELREGVKNITGEHKESKGQRIKKSLPISPNL
jgi:hypothetical protein